MGEFSKFLGANLATIAAFLAAFVAYLALYKNSQPHVVVYYQPSLRQQSIIELVIENTGSGSAFNVTFSQPLPVNWLGIDRPSHDRLGGYIPESGIPSLAPGQRLVFYGGQYAGLREKVGDGISVDVRFKFHPPLWCDVSASETSILGVKHLAALASSKSLDQAVVDAMTGTNRTTVSDIRDALNRIDAHLHVMSQQKKRDDES